MKTTYDYKNHRCKLSEIPETAHWAVMLIETRTYTSRGYDRNEDDYQSSYESVDYYAFNSEAEWTAMVGAVYKETTLVQSYSKPTMVFFKSSGRGKLKVSIDVKIG